MPSMSRHFAAASTRAPPSGGSGQAGLILAGGGLAVVLVTLSCAILGVENGLHPEQSHEIAMLFPRMPLTDFLPEPRERAQCVGFIAGALITAATLVTFPPA